MGTRVSVSPECADSAVDCKIEGWSVRRGFQETDARMQGRRTREVRNRGVVVRAAVAKGRDQGQLRARCKMGRWYLRIEDPPAV